MPQHRRLGAAIGGLMLPTAALNEALIDAWLDGTMGGS